MLQEQITPDFLDDILKGNHDHKYYDKTVNHASEMGVHVEGENPKKLLDIARPSESEEIKAYRLEVYETVTQSLSEKVINTVNKVFNPRLYDIKFPEMTEEDSLEKYLREDYPMYRDVMNFITETFTQKDFSDPNACAVVVPLSFDIEETERFEPIVKIYPAESVRMFKDESHYIFSFGDVVEIYTTTEILRYQKKKANKKDTWVLEFEYQHALGVVPVFRIGGIIKGLGNDNYFESWIRGILPHWNQVVMLTSDIQAAYVNHLYLDKWEYETECEADDCKNGYIEVDIDNVLGDKKMKKECSTCKGTGKVSRGPYGIHTINRDAINPEAPLPTPPAGYIDKPIDIVDKVEARIKDEEKRGLASINMEIVQMVGEDQSGVAKTVDREDLNAFLSRYSRHVYEYVLPSIINYIALWRYSETNKVEKILPEISQPKDFNILTLNMLSNEYKEAANSGVSDNYKVHLEKELINSKFANNATSRMMTLAAVQLNPFKGKSLDDVMTMNSIQSIEDWKLYVYNNLLTLIDMAIEDDSDFLNKETKDQRETIKGMAQKELQELDEPQPIPVSNEIEPIE